MQVKGLFLTPIGTARSGPTSLKRRVMWVVNCSRMSKANHIHCTGRRAQKRRQQPTVANQIDPCSCRRRSNQRLTWLMREDRYFLATFDGDDAGLWPGAADDATWTIAPVVRESDGLTMTLSDGVTP